MWPHPHFPEELVIFTEEILNEKLIKNNESSDRTTSSCPES